MNNSEDRIEPKHTKVMGDFPGHILPGTFFFIFAVWCSTLSILEHVCKRHKRASYLISKQFFHRAEMLEGITIIGMVSIGIIGLQFVAGKPHMASDKELHLVHIIHWHHFVIYFFFGLLGVTKILRFIFSSLPASLTKLMLVNAFFVEAFVFYNHTLGREMLDAFGHQLLSFAIFLAGLVAFTEFLTESNVVLELLRSSLVLLHGTWFWQVAYVLFPRTRSHTWDLTDPNNKIIFTIYFTLHYALAYVIIAVNYAVVTWFVKWRLRRLCPSGAELLKTSEEDRESEQEI